MAGIRIDSGEADRDRQYLDNCNNNLNHAKENLSKAKSFIDADWAGAASAECLSLIDSFMRQINELIDRKTRARNMINTIEATYRDTDRRLAGGN